MKLEEKMMSISQEKFYKLIEKYQAYDLADLIKTWDHSKQIHFFSMVDTIKGVAILEYLIPEQQYQILDHVDEQVTTALLNQMSSDKMADLLLAIHPNQASHLMDLLPKDYRKKIEKLMTYEADTAGSLATVDYISAREYWAVETTLQHIRKVSHDAEMVSYIYVIDDLGKLTGIVSLKEMILENPTAKLGDIIKRDVVSVYALMDQEEVADILAKYDFVALPVLTEEEQMIGIITFDDIIDVIHQEATEDIHKQGAVQPSGASYFDNSVWSFFRKRIGWLLILFVAEAYTGNVLRYFEDTLEEVIALSFFIPLLIGTGGNSGTQTVTTLVRAMAIGEVQFKDMFRVMRKEVATGLFLGLAMGIAAFIRAQLLGVGFDIGTVVAVAAIFIVIWSSFVAGALPLILHKLKIDPAVVSGPFIATFVDGTGLIIYFMMAKVMLGI